MYNQFRFSGFGPQVKTESRFSEGGDRVKAQGMPARCSLLRFVALPFCGSLAAMLQRLSLLLTVSALCSANLITTVTAYSSFGQNFAAACNDSGTSSAQCSSGFTGVTVFGAPLTSTITAEATAAYGQLQASVGPLNVNPTYDGVGNFSFERGKATAEFSEVLTVLGAVGTGTISYSFQGAFTSFTDTLPLDSFSVTQNSTSLGGLSVQNIAQLNHVPFTFQTAPIAITFGTPFTLDVAAIGAATSGVGETGALGITQVDLVDMTVLDANGNPVAFTVSSLPEPASWLLLVTIAAALLLYQSRSKHMPCHRRSHGGSSLT